MSKSQADVILLKYKAGAEGIRKFLDNKARGLSGTGQGLKWRRQGGLSPLHEVAGMAGIELQKYLGEMKADANRTEAAPEK